MSVRGFSLLIFVWMSCWFGYSQDFDQKINGKVLSEKGDIAAIHVSNISTNKGTITDIDGFFTISARLNDTLVFSAVQFKRKEMVVSAEILKNKTVLVLLEESLTKLDEVVVTPYNLSGELERDMATLKVEPAVTASTLGLPNAYVKVKTQNERKLLESKDGTYIKIMSDSIPLGTEVNINMPIGIAINVKRILNDLSGRTKTLKSRIEIDRSIATLNKVKRIFHDSIYEQELKIPKGNINDFMNFCEVDSLYLNVVGSNDILRLWEFLERNSLKYREINNLD